MILKGLTSHEPLINNMPCRMETLDRFFWEYIAARTDLATSQNNLTIHRGEARHAGLKGAEKKFPWTMFAYHTILFFNNREVKN